MEENLQQSGANQAVVDAFGRPLRSLRLSVTDRCNLRCAYCMPEEEYVWLPREDVLTFALNRIPPRYVSRREGSVVTEVALEKEQSRAPIDVAVMEGFRKVSLAPRCSERGPARRK